MYQTAPNVSLAPGKGKSAHVEQDEEHRKRHGEHDRIEYLLCQTTILIFLNRCSLERRRGWPEERFEAFWAFDLGRMAQGYVSLRNQSMGHGSCSW